ncbi:MAG: hypothetical protein BWY45_03507 [Euryarchaeota archaeon ADurb.Bin294]|nr:MAG: hypothetical protein BWY45_03507 [Euryarchaeota archaeon ADurb.Bin294]
MYLPEHIPLLKKRAGIAIKEKDPGTLSWVFCTELHLPDCTNMALFCIDHLFPEEIRVQFTILTDRIGNYRFNRLIQRISWYPSRKSLFDSFHRNGIVFDHKDAVLFIDMDCHPCPINRHIFIVLLKKNGKSRQTFHGPFIPEIR